MGEKAKPDNDHDDHAKKMKKEKKREKKMDKKSKKERKEVLANIHTEDEVEIQLPVEPFQEAAAETPGARQKKKSKKDKEKKKKETKKDPTKDEKTNDIDVEDAVDNQMKTDKDHSSTKKKSKKDNKKDNDDKDDKEVDNKQDRKRKREEKRLRKKALLEQVPKQDKDGISYTKQQIRRMLRRVEKGLPPVPTPQEEAELKRQATLLRAEDEAELAGMLDEENEDNNEKDDDDDAPEEDEDSITHDEHDKKRDTKVDENKHVHVTQKDQAARPNKKRKISKKPVPPDYVCQACKNKHDYPHWIYDCPDKVSVPGTNHVSAGKRPNGTNNDNLPSAKKVFVSGLFFDMKPNQVKAMFQACGKVKSCKLLTFPDTGRCKGQAFVVFETEESAKKALQLSGTKISTKDYITQGQKKKKNGSSSKETETERELELKVHKVLSRAMTKNKT